MKKLLVGLLAIGAFSAQASCENAYKIKAEKRKNSNHTVATIATHVLFFPSLIEAGHVYKKSTFKDNKFQESLDMITAAKKNMLTQKFVDKMEDKLALSAHTDDLIKEIKAKAVKTILKLNNNEKICTVKDGDISVVGFRKLSNMVIESIK